MDDRIILGSRGSMLALAQANMVKLWLEEAHVGLQVQLEIIHTQGDKDQSTALDAFPVLGVFVKEIQAALTSGRIDAAVHSLKDIPEGQPDHLQLASFPAREDARDAFISQGIRFSDLPKGSRVGTGSPRRIMQLRALRPDLEFVPVRGNVDTRVSKVMNGELAGVVLAAAGLRRLGKANLITHSFSFSECIPAIGQAALALECRLSDPSIARKLVALQDPVTADAIHLERHFMKAVGGGCKVPMAAHAYPYADGFRFMAIMGELAGNKLVRIERVIEAENPEDDIDDIAQEIMEECRIKGIATPSDITPK